MMALATRYRFCLHTFCIYIYALRYELGVCTIHNARIPLYKRIDIYTIHYKTQCIQIYLIFGYMFTISNAHQDAKL